ncbi:MAG: fibronectin type III domain-containing protein, partial [Saprospiraceae bacterium]|nr:fibronectin type III domain-containing protein [Saprospiraceae bacterium]
VAIYDRALSDAEVQQNYVSGTSGPAIDPTPSDLTPPILSLVQASGVSASSAIINWTSSELADSQVEYGLDTTYGQQTALDGSLVTSHSQELTGLAANTTYHYRVLSKDAAGNLALSADQSFTTTALPPPVAPVELRATASSSSSIELSWRDQTDDALGFVIERASGAGIFTGIDSTTAEVSTYRDNGLSSGTNYRYRVLAYNANGNSGYSNLATATTYKTFT